MTTALDLINDACAHIGEYATDTALSDSDAQLCLRALQRMLDSWANEKLVVYSTSEESFSTAASTTRYTSASLSSGRPVKIEGMFVRSDSVDYPITLIPREVYDSFTAKSTTGMPEYCYVNPAMTLTMDLYPTPDAVYTVYVRSRRVLASGLALATSISVPPGYELAIVTNLAIAIAPMFGGAVKTETAEAARSSKAALKLTNYTPGLMRNPFVTRDAGVTILTGDW